jgi:hypothetical protein
VQAKKAIEEALTTATAEQLQAVAAVEQALASDLVAIRVEGEKQAADITATLEKKHSDLVKIVAQSLSA